MGQFVFNRASLSQDACFGVRGQAAARPRFGSGVIECRHWKAPSRWRLPAHSKSHRHDPPVLMDLSATVQASRLTHYRVFIKIADPEASTYIIVNRFPSLANWEPVVSFGGGNG